jgi:hypothetical protein
MPLERLPARGGAWLLVVGDEEEDDYHSQVREMKLFALDRIGVSQGQVVPSAVLKSSPAAREEKQASLTESAT